MKIMGQEIATVDRDPNTRGITSFNLKNGTRMSTEEVMKSINNGETEGLMISSNAYGEYVKSINDGNESNNLDSM